jgi:hypothetical protein
MECIENGVLLDDRVKVFYATLTYIALLVETRKITSGARLGMIWTPFVQGDGHPSNERSDKGLSS